jgi:hypothetical protein
MLGTSLASNGMLKPDMSTQAGESMFVATYEGANDSKTGDLEHGGHDQVVPLDVSCRSPLFLARD